MLEATYERIFGVGEKPSKKVSSPLEKGDHPEEDMSEVLDDKNTSIYQSLIGSSQWVIALGRFDIACHVMCLSSFRACPRQGHLDRIKRVYSYLCKMRNGVIRYRTGKPDISSFDFLRKDWSHSAYISMLIPGGILCRHERYVGTSLSSLKVEYRLTDETVPGSMGSNKT
eukprot:scaffold15954_cov105-Skeletonema_menzelii.AAC.1